MIGSLKRLAIVEAIANGDSNKQSNKPLCQHLQKSFLHSKLLRSRLFGQTSNSWRPFVDSYEVWLWERAAAEECSVWKKRGLGWTWQKNREKNTELGGDVRTSRRTLDKPETPATKTFQLHQKSNSLRSGLRQNGCNEGCVLQKLLSKNCMKPLNVGCQVVRSGGQSCKQCCLVLDYLVNMF